MTMKAIVLAAIVSVSASAAAAEGIYIGGSVGKSSLNGNYDWVTTTSRGTFDGIDSLKGAGVYLTGYIGTRGLELSEGTTLGAELSFSMFDTEAAGEVQLGFNNGAIRLDSTIDLKAMLFQDISADTTLYFGAGLTQGSFIQSYELIGIGGVSGTHDFSSTGSVISIGVEHALNDTWSLRGDITYRAYGSVTNPTTTRIVVKDTFGVSGHSDTSVSIGLTWSF